MRVFLLVMDGVGVGKAPDAVRFGDEGSDTLGNTARSVSLECPNLSRLGLGNLYENGLPGIPTTLAPLGLSVRLTEVSAGKDTTTGHWEMAGIIRTHPSPTFPGGFPEALVSAIEAAALCEFMGNEVASGTEIVQRLGQQHVESGRPILYTSADSVLQIAAHVDVVPLERLYSICRMARGLCQGPYGVDRVIARPFEGDMVSGFTRTEDRRDFSLAPPAPTLLDYLKEAGLDVIGVGKIGDIFAGQGLTRTLPVHGNRHVMEQVSWHAEADSEWHGLLFANLVDFDMLYGHRNDVAGFARALVEFDQWLGVFLPQLSRGDLLLITADHGNDPTTGSTDHSREQVPLLIYAPDHEATQAVTTPEPGLIHIGATIAAVLEVATPLPGSSLLGVTS